jgi:hypothetical protein
MNNPQATLKQPTRSGRLLIGLPTMVSSMKKKPPVCDGRCSIVRKCTKCLRKRRAQADDGAARQEKRKARVEAWERRAAHPQMKTDETDAQSVVEDVEDEEYFDQWAPGLVLATPDRPVFTPTPESSPRAR